MTGVQSAPVQSVAPAPVLPAPAPATAEPAARPTPAPRRPALSHEAATKNRPAQIGYLNIDAVPWANVSIAGKHVGDTPIDRFPVPAGSVRLTLVSPDTKKSASRTVRVNAGGQAYVKVDLR